MKQTSIDWSQFWHPGPTRAFTPDEMARAGQDGPSRTLQAITALNFALLAFVLLLIAPADQTARITAALMALLIGGYAAARWLWWRPWRGPLMRVEAWLLAYFALALVAFRWRLPERADREAVVLTLALGCVALLVLLWFLVVWRADQIAARLREQAEREKAIEMARRLGAAQLEPHFLFNTLASVQHWVQTRDARAAPLLEALTSYLRATLPLFKHPLLAAGEELLAVQRYLQVMQARLGAERLVWRMEVDPALQQQALPPGLLLTLVENAVVHGIEPQLRGGDVTLRGTAQGARALFEVIDNGPGPGAALREGVGLTNARERLALTSGSDACLTLGSAPGGGLRAAVDVVRQDLPQEDRPT